MSNRTLRHFSTAAALVLGGLIAAGCQEKKVGEPCTTGQGLCADTATMLACVKGTFASMPCRGAAGCATKGNVSECDNSLSAAGDVCDEIGDFACSTDKKTALSCKDNKFVVEETCKGTRGCALKKDGLYCDNDVSDPGDPCHTVGDYACTTDKKLALKCGADHAMAPLNSCRGAKGCRVLELPEEKKVEFVCDDAVAEANDPCDENGEEACAMDRKGLLKCASGKFAPAMSCAGGCSFDENGERFICEQGGVAAAGGGSKKGAKKGK